MEKSPSLPPKEIVTDEVQLKRVARPIRNVRHIPTKALVFHSQKGPVEFSYENKIKTPIPKKKLVVQVTNAALNPVDLKIKNGYSNGVYGEIGLGREYCGIITHVGEALREIWKEDDVVMGIYYHPHLAKGAFQTSLLIDPATDPIVLKPLNITNEEAAGSLYCLGTAFSILNKLSKAGKLNHDSNVLINGGTTSVGLFALQLLENYYHINKKMTIVTTSTGSDVITTKFPQWQNDLIFINYLNCRGKSSRPLREMLNSGNYLHFDSQTQQELSKPYTQGKYDVVLDFVGGYDILKHSASLIHAGGAYTTTVGDYVADYKHDVFDSWDNPSANARKMFGSMLWSYSYTHFYFDPNATKKEWLRTCTDMLENGTVRCVVDKTYDWKDIKAAVSYMKTQRAQGKLILNVEKF